jgi:NitT/TauT family transport system permease protein
VSASNVARPLIRLGRSAETALWFVGFLLIWELAVRSVGISDLLLPPPSAFLTRIFTSWSNILPHALTTLQLIVIGFFVGAIPAIPLGFAVVMVPVLQKTLYPFLVFLNVIPKVALVPLLLVWFGFGGVPKIIVAALLVFFPIMVNCIAGFESLDPRLLHITRSMGASRWQTLWHLRLPTALPFIISGMKISTVLAVTVVVVSEFVGSNEGLGYLILRATANHDLPLAFACLFVAGLIGLALSFLGDLVERATGRWRIEEQK